MHLLLAAILTLSQAQRSEIDAIVERVMQDRRISGLSIGIARSGTALYLRGYGWRDARARQPADEFTIYRIGSLTKQFTAALVMQDTTAGRIGLDESLRRYLPLANPSLAPVTIAQLLAQTSGVASGAAATPVAPAGTSWNYNNVNYEMLGSILERVDGAGFCSLLQRRIVEPLNLRSTGCAPEATGASEAPSSAAGMMSNAADLLAWLEALRTGRVVSKAAVARMTTSARLANGVPANYGFGFFVTDWFGYRVAEHPGYVDGFSGGDALVLDDGLEIVALSNGNATDLTPLLKSVVGIVDRPLDANLVAEPNRPPQNENPTVTSYLKAIVSTPAFAALGTLLQIEFVERTPVADASRDRYRLTFSTGQWWATVEYGRDLTFESLSFSPVE